MSEQEVREFEENIVKGANIAFQRLVNQKKKEDGELVFSRNGYIFRVKAADLEKGIPFYRFSKILYHSITFCFVSIDKQ